MSRRQVLPRVWLMTDERLGYALWEAIDRLPRGGGIVFRHYATSPAERRRLFARVVRRARARGLVVVRAGAWCGLGADGVHNRRGRGWRTASAHSLVEVRAAVRRGAEAVFVSPVFATRSHPNATVLGGRNAARMARAAGVPAIALGGMDAARFAELREFYGWAGIDVWLDSAAAKPRPRTSLREAGRASSDLVI